MTEPKGDSYTDYMHKGYCKTPKSGFCLTCGVELPIDEGPYCAMCDHVYQEWQDSLLEEDDE